MSEAPKPRIVTEEDIARANAIKTQREAGIHANAVKQGRQAERAEMLTQLGAQTLQDASTSAQLRAERDARPTREEERKHVRGAMGWGMLWGSMLGAAAATVLIFSMQGAIWDAAVRSFSQQAMTGAIIRSGEQALPDRN